MRYNNNKICILILFLWIWVSFGDLPICKSWRANLLMFFMKILLLKMLILIRLNATVNASVANSN